MKFHKSISYKNAAHCDAISNQIGFPFYGSCIGYEIKRPGIPIGSPNTPGCHRSKRIEMQLKAQIIDSFCVV